MTPFGAYLHIPFCARRCDYCAFATWTDKGDLIDRYLATMITEIERAVAAGMPRCTSVFVGGGTPSLVPAESLGRVLDAIPLAPAAEVTVECNPDNLTDALVRSYREHGVNRVSIGVQSMVPHVLVSLGRTHDRANVQRAVDIVCGAGVATFNVDIIYGAAGESRDDWARTLDDVLALDPPHVSAYGLTVEAGTPLALDPARHPDDDDQADKYIAAEEAFVAAGLANYEISNWARPGHECRHNLLYWSEGDYTGFGCAAHSHRMGRRWWNARTPERYLAAVESGGSAEAGFEELDDGARRIEALQLALRLRSGVPASALPVEDLAGLVEVDGGRAVLTVAGRLVANDLSLRLRDDELLPGSDEVGVPAFDETISIRRDQTKPIRPDL